jgi:uncharacterized damage-inducible protein DinB
MTLTESLVSEMQREAKSTRAVLERVPEESLSWTPHPKSLTLGQLAYHVAVVPRGIADLLDPLVSEAPKVPRPEATSRAELLSALEESIAHAVGKLRAWGDEGLRAVWQMTVGGNKVIEAPRLGMVRSLMLNHVYHHRGQLTVYLRLLDVPLPPVYGPTADENPFG